MTHYLQNRFAFLRAIAIILVLTSCTNGPKLETVPHVDLQKYLGKWYEIASYPQWFQKGCTCTTATYSLSPKGYIIVENRCRKDSINGRLDYIRGKAFVVKNSGNAKLKVQFFWPFKGKYWIIGLASDYSYAVVSNPSRKYLWILSRSPKMSSPVYQKILEELKQNGFDVSKLGRTRQATRNMADGLN